jgi:hypothetical protein
VTLLRSIPIRDRNGDQLTVYEFHDGRFLRKVRRLKLCTGELVVRIDENTFAVSRTGEKLSRITAT